jgi:hypothetical protein
VTVADEQQLINRLWAKFSSDFEDLSKVEEIVGRQARAILEEAAANGVDPFAFIENDEEQFLAEVARRSRDRAAELGIRGVHQQSDHAKLFEQTRRAIAGSREERRGEA